MSNLDFLPHDPESFFGLAQPYDRRDLKRAYGKAIRQYKPETHPAEFQRVRDGYERLEKQLRYGRQQQQHADAANAWTPNESDANSDSRASADHSKQANQDSSAPTGHVAGSARTKLTLHQLALVDPARALQKLQAKRRRSPPDYYLAAILTDANAGKPTVQYLRQLVDGLASFPNDPGLIALATEFIRTEVPDAMAAKVVQFVAKKLRTPLFYMLTESLWIRLATACPFQKFAALLKACESQISQSDPPTRTAFYLRLLRTAIWVAPTGWTDPILQNIESRSAELDYTAQSDLEFLTEIRQLKESATTHQNPVRSQLLDAVRLACQSDEAAAVAQVTQVLSDLGRNAAAMQNAFPINTSLDTIDDDENWVSLIHRLVYQLDSYSMESEDVSSDRIITQSVHLLDDLGPTITKILSGVQRARSRYKQWPFVLWLIGGSIVGSLVVLALAFAFFGSDVGAGITLIGIILMFVALVVSFYRWIFPRLLEPRMEASQHRWMMLDYAKHWRSRLFRFAQSNNESIHVHIARIDAIGNQAGKSDLSDTIQYFVRRDAGLCIFAAIRTILR